MRFLFVLALAVTFTGCSSRNIVFKDGVGQKYTTPKDSLAYKGDIRASELKVAIKKEIKELELKTKKSDIARSSEPAIYNSPRRYAFEFYPVVDFDKLRMLRLLPLLSIKDDPDLIAKKFEYEEYKTDLNGKKEPTGRHSTLCFNPSREDSPDEAAAIASYVDDNPYGNYEESYVCEYAYKNY